MEEDDSGKPGHVRLPEVVLWPRFRPGRPLRRCRWLKHSTWRAFVVLGLFVVADAARDQWAAARPAMARTPSSR